MALQYRVLERVRHAGATEAASEAGTGTDFAGFSGHRQCLLVTFKRDGTAVPTPVNFGLIDDRRLVLRSEPHVAKVKRLLRDPHVRLCPCTFRGKPRGQMVEGRARVLPESEAQRADAAIRANYRLDMRVIEDGYDRIGVPMAYVEVTPANAVP